MATRILGMGDLMTMLEKAEAAIDQEEAMRTVKNMEKGKFDLEDFLSTFKQIKKMGPLENLLKLIPGASKLGLQNVKIDPKEIAHIEAIILSMTPYERRHPEILKASRKQRIAKGSGRSVEGFSLYDALFYCNDILVQLSAVQNSIKSLSNFILENHLYTCVANDIENGNLDIIDELTNLFKKFNK
jgi:signal recognition particle subunit SRP54